MDNILAFGDSIVYGAADLKGGWVERLRNFVDKKNSKNDLYCLVYNLGISGDTSQKLLGRFGQEASARIEEGEENLFIISIGINDLMVENKSLENRISLENYKNNLEKIIGLAKKYSQKIVLLGIFPVNEEKVDPIPWKTDYSYKNKEVERYNRVLSLIAKENDILFVDIYQQIISTDYKRLLEDGVHPNSEGHSTIFEMIKEFLVQNKLV